MGDVMTIVPMIWIEIQQQWDSKLTHIELESYTPEPLGWVELDLLEFTEAKHVVEIHRSIDDLPGSRNDCYIETECAQTWWTFVTTPGQIKWLSEFECLLTNIHVDPDSVNHPNGQTIHSYLVSDNNILVSRIRLDDETMKTALILGL